MKKLICLSIALTAMLTSHTASESGQIRDKIGEFLSLSHADRFKPDNYVPFLEYIQTVEPGNKVALDAFAAYRQTHPTAFNASHPIMQWLLKGNLNPLAEQINLRRSGSAAAQSSEEPLRAPDQPETFTLLDEYDIAQVNPNELAFLEGIDGSMQPRQPSTKNVHAVLPEKVLMDIPTLQMIALRSHLADLLNPTKIETEAFKAYLNKTKIPAEKVPIKIREAKKIIINYLNKGYSHDRLREMNRIKEMGLEEPLYNLEQKLWMLQSKENFTNYLKIKGIPDYMLDSVINQITPILIRMIYLETGNLKIVPDWLMKEYYQSEKVSRLMEELYYKLYTSPPETQEEAENRMREVKEKIEEEHPWVKRLNEPILTLSLQDLVDNNMVGTSTDHELPLRITYNISNDILYITEAPKPKDPNINILPNIKIDFDNLDDIKKYSGINWSVVYPIKRLELSLNNFSLKPNLFKNLETITHLGLSKSGIEKIPLYAFRDLPNLEILDLQDNNIDYIEPGTFTNLRKLRHVFFSGNSISDPEERIRIEKEITDASPNVNIHWEARRII